MPRKRTWKVVNWDDLPEGHPVSEYELTCTCGRDAAVPLADGGVIEASFGMGFIHDPKNPPPPFYMPNVIKCRKCGRTFEKEKLHVR